MAAMAAKYSISDVLYQSVASDLGVRFYHSWFFRPSHGRIYASWDMFWTRSGACRSTPLLPVAALRRPRVDLS
jgi:hypothetical protein